MIHIIDCDTDPYVPNNWKVVEHKKGGLFTWDETRMYLYFDEIQKGCEGVYYLSELQERMRAEQVLNANLLDYLLTHPELIPESWKREGRICFWGTIYQDCARPYVHYVRYLYWFPGGAYSYNGMEIDLNSLTFPTANAAWMSAGMELGTDCYRGMYLNKWCRLEDRVFSLVKIPRW